MTVKPKKQLLFSLAALILSAVLLTLIQVPFSTGWLAWIALVPLMIVSVTEKKTGRLLVLSYCIGACYWLGNLYWIGYVVLPGYIVMCLYLALYWPILTWSIKYCQQKKWPLWIMCALLFTGAEAWQGYLITGFSWRLLAHSQYNHLELIQFADMTGSLGISFLIALVNGFIAECLLNCKEKKLFRPGMIVKAGILGTLLMTAIIYGRFRIEQSQKHQKYGPVLGSIQPNIPSNVKEIADNGTQILANCLQLSREAFDAGAEMVCWPETIVLSSMNQDYLNICIPDSLPRLYHRAISNHVYKENGYLLFGAHAVHMEWIDDDYEVMDRFNSAYLYHPTGQQDPQRYDKIHLVPFGEYLPLKTRVPFLYNLLIYLTPYDYSYNLTPGQEFTTFTMKSRNKTHRFSVIICYEDTDSAVTRKMVIDKTGRKKIDWLVNISNDGWYVRYKDNTVLPSVELAQRTAISAFRCIENRISIIRSVNAGISCIITSTGLIKDGFLKGTLPEKAMDRKGVNGEGWFVDRIKIDDRITVYSRIGPVLDFLCGGVFLLVFLITLLDKSMKNITHKRMETENKYE